MNNNNKQNVIITTAYSKNILHTDDLYNIKERNIKRLFLAFSKHRRSWHGLTPFVLIFCLQIYFQQNFFISLLFHLFFLILTCSCQYSYNLMLTTTCMYRPQYLYRVDTCKLLLLFYGIFNFCFIFYAVGLVLYSKSVLSKMGTPTVYIFISCSLMPQFCIRSGNSCKCTQHLQCFQIHRYP